MKRFRWLAILMGITILGITGFQIYWLKNNYDREKTAVELLTNALFRQTILELQASKMKLETLEFETKDPPFPGRQGITVRKSRNQPPDVRLVENEKEPPITVMNLIQQKLKQLDTGATKGKRIMIATGTQDSLARGGAGRSKPKLQTITFSAPVRNDSVIHLNPQMIEEVSVSNGNNNGGSGEKVITIGVKNKPGIFPDTTLPVLPNRDRRIPRLVAEDIIGQKDSLREIGRESFFRLLYNVDSISIKDSVTLQEVTKAYATRLKENKMSLSFEVTRQNDDKRDSLSLNQVTVGFAKPITYQLSLLNEPVFILKKLTLPILFSLFLIGLTIASFVLLYRSLLRQHRLALSKNQFISNITHELKTPIATVGVAIEALKNFNAIDDPERTKEYLEISQNELQRLSLLVDKVLKLSMFENKELELKKEQFDCKALVEEVMNSMKLQFEKHHTRVQLHTSGENFYINADKLHITSVIYNLLDNALKYSIDRPVIDVTLAAYTDHIAFSVQDNGIGIEPAYRERIFDKFFRVPTGNKHNIKGYGLGLSYVAEVVRRHRGQVSVESEFNKGSTFSVTLPVNA